jgi:5-methylcytosine-specific restriction endonuclease McrA
MPTPNDRLDRVVADARRSRESREQGYRAKALKLYPWICGRCNRTFDQSNLRELTVHHRDHNHDNNPEDGSNWELLCLYCHDNEHARLLDNDGRTGDGSAGGDGPSTHKAFGDLALLMAKNRSGK